MRLKEKCGHLMVDSWHAPTQEARELLRARDSGGYSWRAHLRSEMSGGVSLWMWPGLATVLALGIFIRDWWLIIGASVALCFFLYQAITLVRALARGEVVMASSQSISRTDMSGEDPVWSAAVEVHGVRRDVVVTCQTCIDALQQKTPHELAVLVDPADHGSIWLLGYRAI